MNTCETNGDTDIRCLNTLEASVQTLCNQTIERRTQLESTSDAPLHTLYYSFYWQSTHSIASVLLILLPVYCSFYCQCTAHSTAIVLLIVLLILLPF